MNRQDEPKSRVEIERKFLVRGDAWRSDSDGQEISQGYLARTAKGVIRVRICEADAWLTIKSHQQGFTRQEYEYPIPRSDAQALLRFCEGATIEKIRYRIAFEGAIWEVDVFAAENAGLVLAEIELDSESEPFTCPNWVAEEVSLDPRYQNSNLSLMPWSKWRDPRD